MQKFFAKGDVAFEKFAIGQYGVDFIGPVFEGVGDFNFKPCQIIAAVGEINDSCGFDAGVRQQVFGQGNEFRTDADGGSIAVRRLGTAAEVNDFVFGVVRIK